METTTQLKLYDKLGGRKGITALVDDIVDAHMVNPKIKMRFLPYKEEPEKLAKVKGNLVDFMCAGSGGYEPYNGKEMNIAHKGMNINEAEYMAAMDDIMEVLDKHGISEDAKKEVLSILYSIKGDIIEV